jgi:hypothetical protein
MPQLLLYGAPKSASLYLRETDTLSCLRSKIAEKLELELAQGNLVLEYEFEDRLWILGDGE